MLSPVASIIDYVIGMKIFTTIVSLGLLLPGLAVCVRRMHDLGKKWTWILISLIPIIGSIWFIILTCKDSQPGDNQYGYCPK